MSSPVATRPTTDDLPPMTEDGPFGGLGAGRTQDDRARTSMVHRLLPFVVLLVVFVASLVMRGVGLDAYVTIDESRWVQRAADFQALIAQRDDEDTFIIGHPGVTTMWTALLGMGSETASRFSFLEGRTDATRREGYFDALQAARRPFVVLSAVGVTLVALLAWRLFGIGPALLAGGLMAAEPLLVAHARVVHLDSALAVYTSVCLLAALVWMRECRAGWIVLSGLAGGLAFLTKAPSVFVLGFVPLTVLVSSVTRREGRLAAMVRGVGWLLVWGAVAAAVCVALWPALRVSPVETVLKMIQFTERVGGGEHDNFFMGQSLEDPGLLFYPLALLIRLSPITLFGVVAAACTWRLLEAPERRTVLLLAAYCLGFGAMMSVAPKKFDRYLLPLFPLFCVMAGLGWWKAVGWVVTQMELISRPRPGARFGTFVKAGFFVSLLALHVAPLLAIYPYYLSFYSPLTGGGGGAQRAILVGWGEGLDQVARYLNAQPRPLGEPTVATSYHRVLQAQLEGSALPLEQIQMADYVVPYVNTLQRSAEREALAPFLDSGAPVHTVRINGIEYARVYRGPHFPLTQNVGVPFGERIRLAEFVMAPGSGAVGAGEDVQMLLRWDSGSGGDFLATISLVNRDGRVVAQHERPVGADGPDENGRPGEIHRLTVPPRTMPGDYMLVVRVMGNRDRQPLRLGSGEDSFSVRALRVVRPH